MMNKNMPARHKMSSCHNLTKLGAGARPFTNIGRCLSRTSLSILNFKPDVIFKTSPAAGVSVSLAGSEGVKICDLCYCEAAPDQVPQIVDPRE